MKMAVTDVTLAFYKILFLQIPTRLTDLNATPNGHADGQVHLVLRRHSHSRDVLCSITDNG